MTPDALATPRESSVVDPFRMRAPLAIDGPESWRARRRPRLISSHVMGAPELSELERELLELCSMAGEPTTVLDEETVACSPGRGALELVLQGLVSRGLMTKARAINAGDPRRSDGQPIYEDD